MFKACKGDPNSLATEIIGFHEPFCRGFGSTIAAGGRLVNKARDEWEVPPSFHHVRTLFSSFGGCSAPLFFARILAFRVYRVVPCTLGGRDLRNTTISGCHRVHVSVPFDDCATRGWDAVRAISYQTLILAGVIWSTGRIKYSQKLFRDNFHK